MTDRRAAVLVDTAAVAAVFGVSHPCDVEKLLPEKRRAFHVAKRAVLEAYGGGLDDDLEEAQRRAEVRMCAVEAWVGKDEMPAHEPLAPWRW